MDLATAFAAAAGKSPDKPAIYWGSEVFSYARLYRQSQWFASRLREAHGVKRGDRVALWLRNRPEFVGALFGVFQAEAVAVPVNSFLKPPEVAYILQDAGVQVVISEAALGTHCEALQAQMPPLSVLSVDELPAQPSDPAAELTRPILRKTDLALIIYTSGTTGKPKGAMLTHGNLLHNVDSCRRMLETVNLDSFVVLLPMFHSFMLCVGILLPLTSSCSIVLVKSLHPLKSVIDEIMTGRGTILPAIPQFFRTMATQQVPADLPIRLCVSGAAPLPVETLEQFRRKFSFPLLEGYGLSEAGPVVSFNPVHGVAKAGSIGIPIPNVELTIQDDSGQVLPDGQLGELCVRGGNVMVGYWNQPEATARALRKGWLLTGDIGYRDADGYFFVTDRKKDVLLVNGISVYPREIEEVIYEFPGVREAAVIGRPDPRRGEQPVAYVASEDGTPLDPQALLRFLRSRLADYKVPREIKLLPTLPRNASGKLLKTVLRQST